MLSVVISGFCACLGTAAQAASAVHQVPGGFTPVSEELRSTLRNQGESTVRTNSIRTDINRYNAERSTRTPANPAAPNRQVQEFRNGYQPN
ncbi:MAG: hypothetical protein WDN30_01685 [Pararobbsia sp.]